MCRSETALQKQQCSQAVWPGERAMLLQGVLHMSKHTSQEATVRMGSQGSSLLGQILVKGRAFLNRAIDGDTVAGKPWLQPSSGSD
jgi:hypothetical protein